MEEKNGIQKNLQVKTNSWYIILSISIKAFILTGCVFFLNIASAQTENASIQSWIKLNENKLIEEYLRFVSIPNVYGDTVNIRKNASFLIKQLTDADVSCKLLTSDVAGGSPAVYGEILTPGATKTVGFYAHYDGQPVNSKNWVSGTSPFNPVIMTDRIDNGGEIVPFSTSLTSIDPNWRIYGRSTADDKAGVMQIINAFRAIRETGLRLKINIRFLFEGEEEVGSKNLAKIFQKYQQDLKANIWVIADGPRHSSGKKQIVFGVRGDVNLTLTVFGPTRPLHSGNFGNWAPNPAMKLVQLLASMKDKNGMVTIKGFYDDVILFNESDLQAIKEIPNPEKSFQKELHINKPDGVGKTIFELYNLPSLNINGIHGGDIGQSAANVIPANATAVLDLRLAPGNDSEKQIRKLKQHIELQGYFIIDRDPTNQERDQYANIIRINVTGNSYNAQRTSIDMPIATDVVRAVQTTVNYPLILIPLAGGSLPLFLFEKYLNAKPITVTAVNYDNNQHAENENVLIGYLWDGIISMAAIMLMN